MNNFSRLLQHFMTIAKLFLSVKGLLARFDLPNRDTIPVPFFCDEHDCTVSLLLYVTHFWDVVGTNPICI
jgi:hypothetical protein